MYRTREVNTIMNRVLIWSLHGYLKERQLKRETPVGGLIMPSFHQGEGAG